MTVKNGKGPFLTVDPCRPANNARPAWKNTENQHRQNAFWALNKATISRRPQCNLAMNHVTWYRCRTTRFDLVNSDRVNWSTWMVWFVVIHRCETRRASTVTTNTVWFTHSVKQRLERSIWKFKSRVPKRVGRTVNGLGREFQCKFLAGNANFPLWGVELAKKNKKKSESKRRNSRLLTDEINAERGLGGFGEIWVLWATG